jgi:hypothetical protein
VQVHPAGLYSRRLRQIRYCHQFIAIEQQRQTWTHECRHAQFVEQTLEIAPATPRQLQRLTALAGPTTYPFGATGASRYLRTNASTEMAPQDGGKVGSLDLHSSGQLYLGASYKF